MEGCHGSLLGRNKTVLDERLKGTRDRGMTTFVIEDVHDITIDITVHTTTVDIKDIRGSTARIELSRDDAELLVERLHEALSKV